MATEKPVIIFEGVCENGAIFRPSDWPERISSNLARFGKDHRLRYDRSVRPSISEGIKCLEVELELKERNPSMFEFLVRFAKDNKLRIREPG